MKKALAMLLVIGIILSLAACSSEKKEQEAIKKNAYTLSEQVKDESVIDGVMTDIKSDDPLLQRTSASWLNTCVLYEVNIRQYTEEGTFAAFEKHLDRLKDMGINTLWLMPIHPISETNRKGTLGSYYSVTDYKAVNPEFGTAEDFQHLVAAAHDKGFKVMLDWVANHTGWDNAWITEHEDWYKKDKNGKIESPYDWTDTAALDYNNYEMRAEMIECMQYWVEDMGVDGFRCDHVAGVPASFWNAAVYKLKSINSEIMMLAEASAAENLTKYAFDSCYNDALYGATRSVRGGVAVSELLGYLPPEERYVEGSFPMNYLDNHDKNSYEGSIIERYADTYETQLALTYLTPGIPLIYTSDEEGYDHEIEFFEKDTVKWDDDPKFAPLITALSKLKTENPALETLNREIENLSPDNSNLVGFTRTKDGETVIYLSNLVDESLKDVTVDLGFENVTCVIHHDGAKLNTTATPMKNSDFEKKSYNPYEFYVLTAKE